MVPIVVPVRSHGGSRSAGTAQRRWPPRVRLKMKSASAMMTRMIRIVHNMVGLRPVADGAMASPSFPSPGVSKRRTWRVSAVGADVGGGVWESSARGTPSSWPGRGTACASPSLRARAW
jgi:hypothetical protein